MSGNVAVLHRRFNLKLEQVMCSVHAVMVMKLGVKREDFVALKTLTSGPTNVGETLISVCRTPLKWSAELYGCYVCSVGC